MWTGTPVPFEHTVRQLVSGREEDAACMYGTAGTRTPVHYERTGKLCQAPP
jgi:hypothetical protein